MMSKKRGNMIRKIFENHDMKVRVHGGAAVVTGITHAKGISGANHLMPNFASPTHS